MLHRNTCSTGCPDEFGMGVSRNLGPWRFVWKTATHIELLKLTNLNLQALPLFVARRCRMAQIPLCGVHFRRRHLHANGWVLLRLLALFLQVVRLRPESVAIFSTEAAHKSHKSSGVSSVCSCQALEVEEEDIQRVG